MGGPPQVMGCEISMRAKPCRKLYIFDSAYVPGEQVVKGISFLHFTGNVEVYLRGGYFGLLQGEQNVIEKIFGSFVRKLIIEDDLAFVRHKQFRKCRGNLQEEKIILYGLLIEQGVEGKTTVGNSGILVLLNCKRYQLHRQGIHTHHILSAPEIAENMITRLQACCLVKQRFTTALFIKYIGNKAKFRN